MTQLPNAPMTAIDAIYNRRAIRDYLPQKMDKTAIDSLLDAAIHAPTAMHEEPWSFIIIQDKKILNRISVAAKKMLENEAQNSDPEKFKHILSLINQPEFNIFYNANTLIVICSQFQGSFVEADCWLAAENLMLAACAKGFGTCMIGLAVSALNSPEWKTELGIPAETTAVAPIIVGVPAVKAPATTRKKPKIIAWK